MKTNSLFSSLTAALVVAFAASAAQAAEPYREVLRYAFDQPRDATMAIEAQIRAASPRRLRKIEERLLATLRSSQATTDCKNWVCRQLRFAGSERSVPALEPLLADPKLAAVARLALQGIPGPKADAALRRMLGKTQGLLQAGIIQTIGARASDPSAVPLLVPLAQSRDATVVEEALHALGRLGGAEALEALRRARVPARLEPRRQHALLLCAERLAADGKRAQAAAVYGEIWRQARAEALRIGALRGLLACDLKAGLDAAEAALTGSDRALAQGAAQAVCESANPIAAQALLELWDRLAPETKIAALERFSDPGAIQTVVNATQSPNEAVRVAALRAVARLGGVVDAPMLLQIAVARTGETQKATRKRIGTALSAPRIRKARIASACTPGGPFSASAERTEFTSSPRRRASAHRAAFCVSPVRATAICKSIGASTTPPNRATA
ncbi:MAG: HEAT repeat domain-containing protein, partial [Verrucomicrobia bacterium]|nr:HEAT repeat domain-containing protein [Verrucomicrobiota bacterium]